MTMYAADNKGLSPVVYGEWSYFDPTSGAGLYAHALNRTTAFLHHLSMIAKQLCFDMLVRNPGLISKLYHKKDF